MQFIHTLIWLLTLFFFIYSILPAISLLVAYLKKHPDPLPVHTEMSFACIITVNDDYQSAFPLIDSILKQKYSNFMIYLLASHCKKPDKLHEHPNLVYLFPASTISSKQQQIQFAIDNFAFNPEAILLLEVGNLLHSEALGYMNNSFAEGYIAVQGQLVSTYQQENISAIHTISALYNSISKCEVPFRLGSSCAISNQGIAVKTWYFQKYLNHVTREIMSLSNTQNNVLQSLLLKWGHRTAYCKNALVFVGTPATKNPSQGRFAGRIKGIFREWKDSLGIAYIGTLERNWNIFYYGIMHSIPSMQILIPCLLLCAGLGLMFIPIIAFITFSGFLILLLQYLIALVITHPPYSVWIELPRLPFYFIGKLFTTKRGLKTQKKNLVSRKNQQGEFELGW